MGPLLNHLSGSTPETRFWLMSDPSFIARSDSLHSQGRPWEGLARQWSLLGPPLRPSPEDLQRLRTAWLSSLRPGIPQRPLEVVMLGVTPEFADFNWAPSFSLTAIDSSESMIQAVWPGDGPGRRAVLGDWLRMPFGDATQDLVLSDGGLVVLNDREQVRLLSHELRRILRPEGRVVFRHFCWPERRESPGALVEAVQSGKLGNFNELKLRLLMALPGEDGDRSVSLAEAWEAFDRLFPDRVALAERLDCPPEIIATIDNYRGRDTRYYFASTTEIARACAEFSLVPGPAGHYPLAGRCPVFCLTPMA